MPDFWSPVLYTGVGAESQDHRVPYSNPVLFRSKARTLLAGQARLDA